jgi:hypothetical protein
MSCASSWRLYPERSITPHSICGSERLLPGLLEGETRRAERMTGLLTKLVVVEDSNSPNAARIFRACSDVKTILQTRTLHEAYMRKNICTEWLGTESNRRHADFQSPDFE